MWTILRIAAGVLLRALISRPIRHWLLGRLTEDPLKPQLLELRELVTATYVSAHQVKHSRPDLLRSYAIAYMIAHHEGEQSELASDVRLALVETSRRALTVGSNRERWLNADTICELLPHCTGQGADVRVGSADGHRLTRALTAALLKRTDDATTRARALEAISITVDARLTAAAGAEREDEFLRKVIAGVTTSLYEIVDLVSRQKLYLIRQPSLSASERPRQQAGASQPDMKEECR